MPEPTPMLTIKSKILDPVIPTVTETHLCSIRDRFDWERLMEKRGARVDYADPDSEFPPHFWFYYLTYNDGREEYYMVWGVPDND